MDIQFSIKHIVLVQGTLGGALEWRNMIMGRMGLVKHVGPISAMGDGASRKNCLPKQPAASALHAKKSRQPVRLQNSVLGSFHKRFCALTPNF